MSDLHNAFAALQTYDLGSSRAALLPIDQAVMAGLTNEPDRKYLEQRLLAALKSGCSAVAREYVCSKLVLVGSGAAAPQLAALLTHAELHTAACNALQAIPAKEAGKALRQSLGKLTGAGQLAVIAVLGARRETASVGDLTRLLRSHTPGLAAAAAAALGEIASPKAARALQKFVAKTPDSIRNQVADAVLACAERLLAEGNPSGAAALCKTLATASWPPHIQAAITRLSNGSRRTATEVSHGLTDAGRRPAR